MGNYPSPLTDDQRAGWRRRIGGGRAPARTLMRARSLLKADRGPSDAVIAEVLAIHPTTVGRVRPARSSAAMNAPAT